MRGVGYVCRNCGFDKRTNHMLILKSYQPVPEPPGTPLDAYTGEEMNVLEALHANGFNARQIELFTNGLCPTCGGPYRHERRNLNDIAGGKRVDLSEGTTVSAVDLMADIDGDATFQKIVSGMPSIDRLFDGGLPTGVTLAFAANQGCGKTTLLLQLFRSLAKKGRGSLYISTEEGIKGLRRAYKRFGQPYEESKLMAEKNFDAILDAIESSPLKIFAINSLPMVTEVESAQSEFVDGSASAIGYATSKFVEIAERKECLIFLVGHMSSDGQIAGGNRWQHECDGTLLLRFDTTPSNPRRILEWTKLRPEIGNPQNKEYFEMRKEGLLELGPFVEPTIQPIFEDKGTPP